MASAEAEAPKAEAAAVVKAEDRHEDEFEDEAGEEGGENLEDAVRNDAIDAQVHDADNDGKLDFEEFCALVREREMGDHTEAELLARFKAIDTDGSGKVDMNEYVMLTLRDSLSRSSQRVMDIFKQWDDDNSGSITKKEFRRAVLGMGLDMIASSDEIDMVFDSLDSDKSGTLEYKELNKQLRVGAGSDNDASLQGADGKRVKRQLRRMKPGEIPKSNMISGTIDLDSNLSVQEQLRKMLAKNATRVIDLFRQWDDDGNGTISKKEFRQVRRTGLCRSRLGVRFSHAYSVLTRRLWTLFTTPYTSFSPPSRHLSSPSSCVTAGGTVVRYRWPRQGRHQRPVRQLRH